MIEEKTLLEQLQVLKKDFGVKISDLEYYLNSKKVVRFYDGLYYDRKILYKTLLMNNLQDENMVKWIKYFIAFVKIRVKNGNLRKFQRKAIEYHRLRKKKRIISSN